ncbi:MAG TPA: antitoxin VapB family protein [Thermoanaerobaculia bacterium]|nr:antitoxin VapB family protein [Thermoanaerobaculia bacterium]
MATKTISLKEEAWERLRAARRSPEESFSQVILRAEWPERAVLARDYLEACRKHGPTLSLEALDRIEALDRGDLPPENKWKST